MKKKFIITTLLLLLSLSTQAQNPMLTSPTSLPLPVDGISWMSVLRGVIGIVSVIGIAVLMSKKRKAINWKLVGIGLIVQITLTFAVWYVPFLQTVFGFFAQIFVKIMDFTKAGTSFLAGSLMDQSRFGSIFIFQVLPTIIFFSALTSLLYHWKIIQRIVYFFGWCLRKIFRVSGSEVLAVVGNTFLGMIEALMLVKHYLPKMNRSELFLVMSSGMATISGSLLIVYTGMLGGDDPESRLLFARSLISASVVAMPAVILLSKIIEPQKEKVEDQASLPQEELTGNSIDAIVKGTIQGVKLAVNVAALLLVFIALVALMNYLLDDLLGKYTGLNQWIMDISGGEYSQFNLQFILGMLFTPISWLIGIPWQDMSHVGSLLGTKLVLNEFVAYIDLAAMKANNVLLYQKSIIMASYLLCGFANIGSVGLLIGGMGSMAPNRRTWITQIAFKTMICGALASALSASIVGAILG